MKASITLLKHAPLAVFCLALVLARMDWAPAQSSGTVVMGEGSLWRFHAAWRRPATVDDGEYDLGGGYPVPNPGTRWILSSFTEPTPPPPADWKAPDFDDSGWPRRIGPPFDERGYGHAAEIYIVCGRTRFALADPTRTGQLKLHLTYRGGAVVYLNGTEIARGHMPPGKVEPLTLAADYAQDVFLGPDGALLPTPPERGPPPANLASHYQKRFRTLTANLPSKLLVKGTNVLAVELHRAAVPAKLVSSPGGAAWNPTIDKRLWGTCGLESVSLTGPPNAGLTADVVATSGVQIWNCDALLRPGLDVQGPGLLEPLRPVRLAAPCNGVSSEQLVVSSDKDLRGVSAVLGALKADSGDLLSRECVQIRYATVDDRVPMLLDRPARSAQITPIWLTARVPKDAAPGQYRGTLSIQGLDKPLSVPVEITVDDWTLPELCDYGTSVSLLHCPEAVARHYKVPLWSEEHFKLLERSMALMGYAGNTLLSVSAIGEDVFGDQPLLVFRKEGGAYLPDFRFVRRYLKLYGSQAPPPRQLSVQVWNYSVSQRGFGRDGGTQKWMSKTIKVRLLEGDKLVPAEIPVYTQPGTEATWAAVAAGMKQIVKELGWKETRLLWGTGGDNLPNDEIVAFFKRIAPDVHWRVVTHGGSVRNWGLTPEERTQPGGLVLGYANLVRRNVTRRPLVADCPFDVLKRDGVTSAPMDYLTMAPLGRIAAGYSGIGFLSFDGWPWPDGNTKPRSPIRSYVGFGNIHASGAPFVAPGADGAAPSPQLEALREGLQITEAILQLRAALAGPQPKGAIAPDVAAEAKQVVQTLMDVMESNRRLPSGGAADIRPLVRRVYRLVAEAGPPQSAALGRALPPSRSPTRSLESR